MSVWVCVVCTPVPVSPHMMRGTAVLGGAAVCPHTQRRPPDKRPTHQLAAQLETSVLWNYSQEPWIEKTNKNKNTANLQVKMILLKQTALFSSHVFLTVELILGSFIVFSCNWLQAVSTNVMKFSVWTAAWAKLWGGGATQSVWSFLMSLRSEVIWLCTASCLWTRSHYTNTHRLTYKSDNTFWQIVPLMKYEWSHCDGDVCWS